MKKICDIYLQQELTGASKLLKQLRIFQPDVTFDDGKAYSGFLGLQIDRITAVSVVTHFRNNAVHSLNVPISYREARLLTEAEAYVIAEKHVQKMGGTLADAKCKGGSENPMYWVFQIDQHDHCDIHEGGGLVTVDSLDGHLWEMEEMVEYMYDYNNVL